MLSRAEIEAAVLDQYQALIDLKAKSLDGIVVAAGDHSHEDAFNALVSNVEEELGIDGEAEGKPPRRLTDLVDWLAARAEE